MGVDLGLIPIMYDTGGAVWPHVRLELDRQRELWEVIEHNLTVKPLGRALWYHNDDKGSEERTDDPYGTLLTMASAGDLASLLADWIGSPHGVGAWTRASAAFLAQLPPETGVILWWH